MSYHISEHARQKILKEIAIRAQKMALDITYDLYAPRSQLTTIPLTGVPRQQVANLLPEIRAHIRSILSRLEDARTSSPPVLLPAKTATSPRETLDIQAFLVVCPADITTIVNALFPERRSSSRFTDLESPRRGGLVSAASSISKFSLGFPAASTPGDGGSVLGASASSTTSNTASREPFLESHGLAMDTNLGFLSTEEYLGRDRLAPTEGYGRRLRRACAEMSRVLGVAATSGSCHPCAERWAVLFVSHNGNGLQTRMRQDVEVDDHEDDCLDTDSEGERPANETDLESNYHQLKAAVTKLLEEFEIPRMLAPEAESKGFSNRTSYHPHELNAHMGSGHEGKPATRLGSKNPYHDRSQISKMIASQISAFSRNPLPLQHPQGKDDNQEDVVSEEAASALITMLDAAINQCIVQSDFVCAHLYHKALYQLRNLSSPTLVRDGFSSLLNYFARGARDSLTKSARAIEEYDAWFVWLQQSQERHDMVVKDMMRTLRSLRDKMWYTTDVRNSGGYEEARNVALALKAMIQPPKASESRQLPAHKPRAFSKSSSTSFLLRTEAQVFDLMAASTDYGGPNKLSDEQSDMTSKWLTQHGIENICKGEERIHRLCLEIDKCVGKLVGDGMLDGPVLWSSELYRTDKEFLDRGRRKGDLILTGVGSLSIVGDEEHETQHGLRSTGSLDFAARQSQSNLRSMSYRNGSQQSFDSGRWGSSRSVDLANSPDYSGGTNPLLLIDTNATFWSPFQTQASHHSNTVRARYRTTYPSRDTVALDNSAAVSHDKRRFLLDLKQTLTGLLLSDFGTTVFSRGSETDVWFSSELAKKCIQLKSKAAARHRRSPTIETGTHAVGNAASNQQYNGPVSMGQQDRSEVAVPVATLQPATASTQPAGECLASSGDATGPSSGGPVAKPAEIIGFPYDKAFRQLLRKFSVCPNPYAKLHALHELELLIILSLSSRSGHDNKSGQGESQPAPQVSARVVPPAVSPYEPATPITQVQDLEQITTIHVERPLSSKNPLKNPTTSIPPASAHRSSPAPIPSASTAPGTDMVVAVLQDLFRDPETRPRTLFRDLQYIAAFVPTTTLDRTAEGKAFCDAAIAALGLKQDACHAMIEIADAIVARNTQSRGVGAREQQTSAAAGTGASPSAPAAAVQAGSADAPATGSADTQDGTAATAAGGAPAGAKGPAADPLAHFSMTDAASMLLLAAKEGAPVAERELAIFYLTHPDLLPRAVLPLARPRDVFRGEAPARPTPGGRGGGGLGIAGIGAGAGRAGREREREREEADLMRSDPLTMCVAQHWMECSRRGGDALAEEYLRARDEMERV